MVNKLNKILETTKIIKDDEYTDIFNDYESYSELRDEEELEDYEEKVFVADSRNYCHPSRGRVCYFTTKTGRVGRYVDWR